MPVVPGALLEHPQRDIWRDRANLLRRAINRAESIAARLAAKR